MLAIEEYFKYMYDDKLKIQLDSWIISDVLTELNERNINYTVINSFLDMDIIGKRSKDTVGPNDKLNPWIYTSDETDYSFHLKEEDSITLAELWYDKIETYFK